LLALLSASAQQTTGVLGCAQRHHHHQRHTTAAARPRKFGGVIKEKATDSTPWWDPARGAAKARSQHFLLDQYGRLRLRVPEHVRAA